MLKAQQITPISQSVNVSIRGMSIVNEQVAWVSGTKGSVGLTIDGGLSWKWQQVKGFEKSDFRGIEAFSEKEAVIIGSGTPAVILKTLDGGKNWAVKFNITDTTYFLDAIAFSDKNHGFILGDPINGKFLMLETLNAGEDWLPVKNAPDALKGEAAFAASGTCLRVSKNIGVVTGGSVSRLLISPVKNIKWAAIKLPLTNGSPSMGAFSLSGTEKPMIVVGGNYAKDTITDSVAYVISKSKKAQQGLFPVKGPAGYQSCVEHIKGAIYISTGTSGSNITTDGGKTWTKFDDVSYNVCRKSTNGKLILFAGDRGRIGLFKF
ncbi:WD40/YVTN/BNR-like repeat-containing protein [Mucilaginibacter pallidiroseus]|nr:YCF48-related protein [Mucilaginibacter pallidiroseus]